MENLCNCILFYVVPMFGTILLGIVATPITLTDLPQATDGKYGELANFNWMSAIPVQNHYGFITKLSFGQLISDEEAEQAKQYAKVVVGVLWGGDCSIGFGRSTASTWK